MHLRSPRPPRFNQDKEISDIVEVTSSIQLQDLTEEEPLLTLELDGTVTRPAIVRALPPVPSFAKPPILPPPPSVARLEPPPRKPSSAPPPASGVLPILRLPTPVPPPPVLPMALPMALPPLNPPPRLFREPPHLPPEPPYLAPEPPRYASEPPLYRPSEPPRMRTEPPARMQTEPPQRARIEPQPRKSSRPAPPAVSPAEPTISVADVPPRVMSYPTMIVPRLLPLPKMRFSKRAIRDAATGIAGVIALALLTAMGAVVARDFAGRRNTVDPPPIARMVVTVAGPGGTAVPQASVFVDGKELCRSAPCTIEPLERGIHFVKVVAPGYNEAAARAVTLNPNELRSLHFDMIRVAEPTPPPPPTVTAPPPVATISPAELPTEPRSDEMVSGFGAQNPRERFERGYQPRSAAPAAPAATTGTLNMNSNPPSNVLLDGRPLGQTPQRATSVSAGAHSVLFVHPDYGRAARRVVVPAGGSQSVSVNFEG